MNEEYEAIEIVVKSRTDGKRWFDVLFDVITENCEGPIPGTCNCGLEHMGGTIGDYEACWKWINTPAPVEEEE